jgi:hypothetical protein
MAEVLLSPGVLARENDQSFITSQPVQAGAAIIGPAVKGPVGIPTMVTSYSDYQNKFGTKVTSGSAEYTYFTSIAAYNYFQQGGDTLIVTRVASGSFTSATSTPISNSLDTTAFELETLTEGTIANTDTGTPDGIKWEIVSPDTASGTFNLLVRKSNDSHKDKVVLETWTDLTLDPNSDNYVAKVIGDTKQSVTSDNGEYYIQYSGQYTNASRYVRVKSVGTPTLNYFDNTGTAKDALTGSIPVAMSGTFAGGVGGNVPVGRAANYYGNVDNTDSQGLVAGDYTNSINLLSNKDLFRYNVIVTPGLIREETSHATELTKLVNNSATRGDSLAIIDLVKYGANIGTVKTEASGVDSSYAATYWPWLQTIDPDTAGQVWVPASTMMPGVFAFNDRAGEAWFAPAGLNRGGLSTVIRAERSLTNGNRNELYTKNVNPIATFPNTGVVVFGQKTLQKKASALDRVNVRRLLITLKSFISQIADNLVFEQNTTATRNNFLSQVNPYLASVQQRQGLYAFKVVMDDSNNTPDVIDRNQLVGQIFIQPTKTAEFIYLDFNVMPTGATFPA